MDELANKNFVSLRTALKVCSFAVLLYACFDVHRSFEVVHRAEDVWIQMIGSEVELPAWTNVVDVYWSQFVYVAALGAALLLVCFAITRRSQGGAFLYVNFSLFVVLGVVKNINQHVAMQMLAKPVSALTG